MICQQNNKCEVHVIHGTVYCTDNKQQVHTMSVLAQYLQRPEHRTEHRT